MSKSKKPPPASRVALLTRAAIEAQRYTAPAAAVLNDLCDHTLERLDDAVRTAALERFAGLTPAPAAPTAGASGPTLGGPGGGSELMRQRASLELKVQTEAEKRSDVERTLEKERTEHREAVEALALQRRKLKESEDERSRLLTQIAQLESKLCAQINATEQVEMTLERLKASTQAVGGQATEQAERINALQAEIEHLRAEREAALKTRDADVSQAASRAGQAEQARADVAFARLWGRMQRDVPDVFAETIVPDEGTFERLCDALVESLRVLAALELHVHQLLRDLRQVGDRSDKLSQFYIMFTKNPGLLDALRDYLVNERRKGNFVNLLRAQQAWARAFATGTYKTIVRSPVAVAAELNYKSWPLKTGFTKTEDAALGEYFKASVQKIVPEKLGTLFRKQAAETAYEDYDNLMKRR